MTRYFLDTYALIEIAEKNHNFEKYTNAAISVTSDLNLMETKYILIRNYGTVVSEPIVSLFEKISIAPTRVDLLNASDFKLKMKKENNVNVSYIDATGYEIAKRIEAKFVTGDKAFEKLENVEFVK